MKRMIMTIYFWISCFFLSIFLSSLIIVHHLFWGLLLKKPNETFGHSVATFWAKSLIMMMPGWKVEVSGLENFQIQQQPYVIVSNHESMADIWAIYFLDLPFRWLAKDSIFNIPFVGRAMKYSGYVSIRRGQRDSHEKALDDSRKRLRQGINMVFFPEGTRSLTGIKKFKLGAFKIACEENRPVLPVAIHGARDLLPKNSIFPSDQALIRIAVLPPLFPSSADKVDLESFADRTRGEILKTHEKWTSL
jgi:1-acyl-sn-glycerol-3-phosphate acyltransferase